MNDASEGECLSPADMRAYHAGQMSADERHAVERHLLDCPLCALAWGDEEIDPTEVERGAQAIAEMAWDRVAEKKKRRRGAFIWMSAAAGIALLVTIGWLFMQDADKQNMDQVFAESMDKAEYEPGHSDAEAAVTGNSTDSVHMAERELAALEEAPGEKFEKSYYSDGDRLATQKTETKPLKDSPGDMPTLQAPKADYTGGDRAYGETVDSDDDAGGDEFSVADVEDFVTSNEPDMEMDLTEEEEEKPRAGYDTDDYDFGDDFKSNGADNGSGSVLRDGIENDPPMSDTTVSALYADVDELRSEKNVTENLEDVQIVAMDESATPVSGGRRRKEAEDKLKDREDVRAGRERSETAGVAEEAPEPLDFRNAGDESYRKKQYKEAGIAYERHLANNPKDQEARLLYAISLLRTDQAEKALTQLDILLEDRHTRFHEDAEWYKALAFIRLHRKSEAKTLLQRIVQEKGKWAADAQETLSKL